MTHRASYQRVLVGRRVGAPRYAHKLTCRCGWTWPKSDRKRVLRQVFADHFREMERAP